MSGGLRVGQRVRVKAGAVGHAMNHIGQTVEVTEVDYGNSCTARAANGQEMFLIESEYMVLSEVAA